MIRLLVALLFAGCAAVALSMDAYGLALAMAVGVLGVATGGPR
jgi:hypothetical protein